MRKLLEKDFILSKTEFVSFLKCPFQFYLLKELQKEIDGIKRRDFSNYEQFLVDGIEKHYWLERFYENYHKEIENNTNPSLKSADRGIIWKEAFLDFEIRRYRQNPDFWKPIAVEFYLETNNYRGKIDRIDKLNKEGHCRIIDYKSYPGEFDEEELLFYALLLSKELPHQKLPAITKVAEIGLYYYSIGDFYYAQITTEIVSQFCDFLEKIRLEMLELNSIKKHLTCDFHSTNCLYREICQRIHIKHQKKIGLLKK